MKTKIALSLVVLLLASFAAAQVTFDHFQVTPPPNTTFTELRAGTYGGSDAQGDYSVTVTLYTRELTKADFLRIVAALSDGHAMVTSRDNLDFFGQPGVMRLWKTSTGKACNWITFKGVRVYQITFASDRDANQINFDVVNNFMASFEFVN